MGNPFKKKSTSVKTYNTTTIQHKIIKFSYLQTLAVTGGLGTINDLAGETEASSVDTKNASTSKDAAEEALKKAVSFGGFFTELFGEIPVLGEISEFMDKITGGIVSALFGKSVSTEINTKVEDSGWRVTKSWLQPEFDKIRYAMGIRELSIAQFRYEKVSEVVSTSWSSPKEIAKVTLIVDDYIPNQFPSEKNWIEYYVKPEIKNAEWIRINPVGKRTVYDNSGNIVPRIVNFNSERPATARLEEKFISYKESIRSVRFRAILKRPESIESSSVSADSYTPILKSYRMLLFPRGGL